jgi:hypothetical protein
MLDGRWNAGAGGQLLAVPEGESLISLRSHVSAKMQRFMNQLAGSTVFKTYEVFVSALSAREWGASTPHIVAAAYRKQDKRFGESNSHKSAKPVGVYCYSDKPLSPLRDLMIGGEPFGHYEQRIGDYINKTSHARVTNDYVDYRALATIVAYAANKGPDERGPGPQLWSCAERALNLQWPRAIVRTALLLLVTAYKNRPLLEEGEDRERLLDVAKQLILLRIEDSAKQDSAIAALPEAFDLWEKISQSAEAIAQEIRQNIYTFPAHVPEFLFHARAQTYVPWLQSATLQVEQERGAVLHTDLDRKIASASTARNKPVDVIAKTAYETAAAWVLGDGGTLKSMLLAPFSAEPGHGLKIHGFVRLMNRFSDGRLHDYGDQIDFGTGAIEEMHLARALSTTISAALRDPELLGFNGLPPGDHPGSDK